MAAELCQCHFQLAKLRVVAVVALVVVAPSVQTLWGISISWYQLTKKCIFFTYYLEFGTKMKYIWLMTLKQLSLIIYYIDILH